MADESLLSFYPRLIAIVVIYGTVFTGVFCGARSIFFSDERLLVVRENGVTPSLEVKGSPGLNQSTTSLCERIQIRGFPRSAKQMVSKYTHSLKITVNASAAGNTSNIHVCFHRNSSLAVGMCADYEWEEVTDGLWTAAMSPFDHILLDVRVANSSSNATLQVSTLEGSFMYRISFLILGTVLMTWASTLSTSLAFYCVCCFAAGLLLVFLLLLFQGLKRLPTRPSCSALFLYASLLGLTYVSLPYIPGLVQDFQTMLGFLDITFSRYLQLAGLMFGFWALNSQLLLAPDDTIDISTSVFISWCTRILAAVLILQSSGDALLGGGAVAFVIVISPLLRKITALIFPPRDYHVSTATNPQGTDLSCRTNHLETSPSSHVLQSKEARVSNGRV
ncbi:unnamed protein product [Thlaspi arvense]|uniref:Uncharacterized protein n=1 Tax=Thlaspi arvense TaxID=13288 RepID=A0AAU9T0F5_THLAR|nr:unnamed protein product [Thlaspi arvense]